MHDLTIITLFVKLDDFLKTQISATEPTQTAQYRNQLPLNTRFLFLSKNRSSDRKMSLSEIATIFLLHQCSRTKTFKAFLFNHHRLLKSYFPNLLSYSRMVHWIGKLYPFLQQFVHTLLTPADAFKYTSVYALDSTKVNPHQDKHFPKTLRRTTGVGKTHDGWFIGYKLHLLVDTKGHIYRYDISCGNANDRDPVKGGLLDGIVGVVFADRGYVGAQLAQELKSKLIKFVARPTDSMTLEKMDFEWFWAKKYRQRQAVEGVFHQLKNTFNLVPRFVKSANCLRIYILANLCMYCLHKLEKSPA